MTHCRSRFYWSFKKVTQECIKFYELIQNLIKEQEFLEVSEIVVEILDKSGYRDMLEREQTLESRSRLENIDEFMSVPKDYEEYTIRRTILD